MDKQNKNKNHSHWSKHSFANFYLPCKCKKVYIMENQQVHMEIFNVIEVKHERTANICYLKIKRERHTWYHNLAYISHRTAFLNLCILKNNSNTFFMGQEDACLDSCNWRAPETEAGRWRVTGQLGLQSEFKGEEDKHMRTNRRQPHSNERIDPLHIVNIYFLLQFLKTVFFLPFSTLLIFAV